MEAVLTAGDVIEIRDEASLTLARDAIRKVGASADVTGRAALVVSELGRNHLRHARFGEIAISPVEGGLEIVAVDRGAVAFDVAAALDAMPRAHDSLGVGISSVRRLSCDLDVDVRLGEGTRFVARVLEAGSARRREVGAYGRPHKDETLSGDHAAFVRTPAGLVVAVCDGLGHGPAARVAANAAIDFVRAHATDAPATILSGAHAALAGTRGAVMAVVRIADAALDVASIGNVDVQLVAPRSSRRFGGSSAVLGASPTNLRVRTETAPLAPHDVVILSTDGITSRLSIDEDLPLLRAHPVAIAQRVIERFGREDDDALVVAVR